MKVSVKDLVLGRFDMDVEPSDTVGTLRQKLIDEKGWSESTVKLLYSGKMLQDETVIGDLNLTPSNFIICLKTPKVAPRKTTKAAAPAPASSSTQTEPVTPAAQTQSALPPAPTAPLAPITSSDFLPRVASASTPSDSRDPNFEANVSSLIQLGFGRPEAVWALKENQGNLEGAADLLMAAQELPEEGFEMSEPGLDVSSDRPNIVLDRNELDQFLTGLAQRAPAQFDQVVGALQSNPQQLTQILESMDIEQRRPFLELLQSNPLAARTSASTGADREIAEDSGAGGEGEQLEETVPSTTREGAAPEPSMEDIQALMSILPLSETEAREWLLTHHTVENVVEVYFGSSGP